MEVSCEVDGDCSGLADRARCGLDGYCQISGFANAQMVPGHAADAGDCPAPAQRSDVPCLGGEYWARDPSGGACCRYADSCLAPVGWPRFRSEAECLTSCRCSNIEVIEGADPIFPEGIEHTSLQCACLDAGCPQSPAEASALVCPTSGNGPPRVTRTVGCGMVAIDAQTGLGGTRWVFDERSGALIGVESSSDVPSFECGTSSWIAGRDFACNSPSRLVHLCGDL